MPSALELHDSRVSEIDLTGGIATVHFSHAYIHKSKGTPGTDPGTGWSQEALLILADASSTPLPPLPNTILEGSLEVGGIKHCLIPLPFKRKVNAKFSVLFQDGTGAEILGTKPYIELLGVPIYVEDVP